MPPIDPVELTQRLVQIDSTSRGPGQQQVFDAIGDLLGDAGFTLENDATRPARYLLASTRSAGPRLLFVCHVDTVPVDSPGEWTFPAHSGHISDGRLHGRGASDMKSGLAAALAALVRAGPDGRPAAILLTADEEVGCLGARAAAAALRDHDIGAIVVPESTDNTIALGHRGTSWVRLSVRGRAAHAGTPQLGSNALLPLAAALLDLERNGPWWGQRTAIGTTTLNVATMRAGTAPNIVPETAQAVLDVRPVSSDLVAEIAAWLADRHPKVRLDVELDLPPIASAGDDPWIRSLPAPAADNPAVPYFTDAAELIKAWPGAPVAIWGPGQAQLAHCRDESVPVENIRHAAEGYLQALGGWCPVPDEEAS